jgi:hypothetical protein
MYSEVRSVTTKVMTVLTRGNNGTNKVVCALGHLQVWIVAKWLRGLWVVHYRV